MTTTLIRTHTTTAPRTAPSTAGPRHRIWRHGLAASVTAAAATTALGALGYADGISFATEPGGAGIPVAGFAQLTLIFSLIGVAMASVMARKARRPHRTFVPTLASRLARTR